MTTRTCENCGDNHNCGSWCNICWHKLSAENERLKALARSVIEYAGPAPSCYDDCGDGLRLRALFREATEILEACDPEQSK